MSLPSGDSEKLATLLTALLGKVEPAIPAPPRRHEAVEPLVHMLIYSFMLWESTPATATAALDGLYGSIIDLNELRVALPDELAECMGQRDRASRERADRLRAVLNNIFRLEHRVSLERLADKSKREVREYLDALDGMPPFVAARATLLGFHGHAIPLDHRLFDMLMGEQVIDPALSLEEAERWLERQIRASDAEQIVLVLESWREDGAERKPPRAARTKKAGPKAPRTAAARQTKKDS